MIIAANLKTNFTRARTEKYIKEIESFISEKNINQDVLVFPASSSLLKSFGKINIGTQNAYFTENGAFTGEIGLEQLEEFQIKTILIGHSERRHILGESQETVLKKFNFYKNLGFKIVYCIGESLEIRKAGKEKMMNYISSQLAGVDLDYKNLVIAYEPVWAIGTGLTPSLQEIQEMHKDIREKTLAPLLYGGSVKVTNAKDVLALKNIDGILVGSASLDSEHFCNMCEFAQNLQDKN